MEALFILKKHQKNSLYGKNRQVGLRFIRKKKRKAQDSFLILQPPGGR
jgi:hypothetical protein